MPPGNGIIAPAKPKVVTVGPQNVGLPGYRPGDPGIGTYHPTTVVGPQNVGLPGYRPGDPNPGGGPGFVAPVAGPAYTGAPAAPAAPAAPPPPPAEPPHDAAWWENQVSNDAEGRLQQGYLDQDNTLTTRALRQAWLQHTQGVQDSYNAHGALFSGAAANAQNNAATDYNQQLERQKLTYDRGSHDIHTSVMHRLLQQLTGVDDGMGN